MKKNSDVWECKCSSIEFMLQRGGTVTCRKCEAVQSAMSIRFDNPDDQPNKKWSTKIVEWIKTTAGIGYLLQISERVFHSLTPELTAPPRRGANSESKLLGECGRTPG